MRKTTFYALILAGALAGTAALAHDGGPGMMCRGGMHGGMHHGGMMGAGPFEHVEGHLAFLKTELKITSAQEKAWNEFAETMRKEAAEMKTLHDEHRAEMKAMTDDDDKPVKGARKAKLSAPDRLARMEDRLENGLKHLKIYRAAVDKLYGTLSAEQKKTADELLTGPLGRR